LSGVLKNEIAVRGRAVEHAEAELVLLFPAVKLLRVYEQIYIRVNLRLVVAVTATRDYSVSGDLAHVTVLVICSRPARAVRTEQLEVLSEGVARPKFPALAVSVLRDRRVFDKSYISAALHQTPESARVPEIILGGVSSAIPVAHPVT